MRYVDSVVKYFKSDVRELLRMGHWLILALLFYFAAVCMANQGMDYYPQAQTVLWKLGHLTIAAFAGYWIDRNAFRDRMSVDASPLLHLRRAIIIVGAMIAISLGM
jgi:hypothetical protein